ncbi:MAG: hypothetical protein BWY06_02322 [Candidatus Latescibacteria bacterium ADurb.Bin168]|nr:MAG: hypothetical protein BWY06_02322 [Candidatus Latescibacteria bacterium ADurb.Bin168]
MLPQIIQRARGGRVAGNYDELDIEPQKEL